MIGGNESVIKNISIKNVATYDQEGINMENLKKINFIYGNNGTGKTTLSEFLRMPQNFPECTIDWNDRELKIFVYNRNFVKENFKEDNSVKGIFTLGKESVELQSAINELKEKIKRHLESEDDLSEKISTSKNELNKLIETFKDSCWEIKKNMDKLELKETIEGYRNSRDKFMQKFLDEAENNHGDVRTLEELKKRYESLYKLNDEKLTKYDQIPKIESFLEDDNIFQTKIIGKEDVDISRLINKLQISDWVKQGQIISKHTEGVCPFCQQSLPESFEEKLNLYFDQTYTENIQRLESVSKTYIESVTRIISKIESLISIADSFIDKSKVENYFELIKSKFEENKLLINTKLKEPSRSIGLVKISEFILSINQLVAEANQKIDNHNQLIENIKAEKESLSKAVWRYIVERNKTNYIRFKKEKEVFEKKLIGLEASKQKKASYRQKFEQELIQKQQQVTSVHYSILEINRVLEAYGFTTFRLAAAEKDGNYKIVRQNGEDAHDTLSEGERSFITFLYFYQLLKGSNDVKDIQAEKVVVVDDPISSLDSNVLFIVSSLIRKIMFDIKDGTSDVKQLFILTHNIYFHKEVTYNHGNKNFGEASYWILRKNSERTSIQRYLKNPIKTSYELLWQELRNPNNRSQITVQNIMRRILENYFKFFGNTDLDDLENAFEDEERLICRSLLTWINDGSHSVNEDLYIESNDDIVNRYMLVFKKIFEKTSHQAHYEMMMRDFELQDTNISEASSELIVGMREVAGTSE